MRRMRRALLLWPLPLLACSREPGSFVPPDPGARGVLAPSAPSVPATTSVPSTNPREAAVGPAGGEPAATPDEPARCPESEVWIPATPASGFVMGRGMQGKRDIPHRVVLTRGFCLDAFEVTSARYEVCVKAGSCRAPGQADEFATYGRAPEKPVNLVSWGEARTFCASREQRLPTEAEWEWAARGPGDATYPWGESAVPTCADELGDFTEDGAPKSNPGGNFGCHGGGPSEVGKHPKGDKHWPGGALHDLGGNVWEWTEDSYAPYPDTDSQAAPVRDPLVRLETATHVIRGGAWNRHPLSLITTYRGAAFYLYHVPGLGFRCARGAPHASPPPRSGPRGP